MQSSYKIPLERELFVQALEKSGSPARSAFLDSACGDNPEMRRRVEELLEEAALLDGFLSQPVWNPEAHQANGKNAGRDSSPKPGDLIQHYKILQPLGEGGCGVVFRARQLEPLRREVALKVIKLGMDTKEVIARFEAERQTLALMDHPNIAKVFDAGATQSGRPFFVMELVRGVRLTDHCNRQRLNVRQRLELFVQVCQGVQHAHQKGIIHRDIKPSNILVARHGGQAVPKIIDFGIARATRSPLSRRQTRMTSLGQVMGTPAYMSPEQAESCGRDVDTRSDIYSLGALLYELLTGRTPFDQEHLLEATSIHTEDEVPLRPSARLPKLPRHELLELANERRMAGLELVRCLKGDLDWICLKALDPDRKRRYATATALARDVEHYLADEPILARPPSQGYRLRKLFRRKRAVFTTLGILSVVLVAATALSTWLAFRAEEAEMEATISAKIEFQLRRQAERERERAARQARAARLNEYVADINLAHQSLLSGNYARAVQLLDKCVPSRGMLDPRGFEWRYIKNLAKGDEHTSLPKRHGAVRSLSVSPDNRWLSIGTGDSVDIWDLQTGSLLRSWPIHQTSTAFIAEAGQMVVGTAEDIRVVDLLNGTETKLVENEGGFVAASADGAQVAAGLREGVRVWDSATWKVKADLPGARPPLAFSPDGQGLATGTGTGIAIWDLPNGTKRVVLEASQSMLRPRPWDILGSTMTFAAGGRLLVTPRNQPWEQGGWGLATWDTQTGSQQGFLPSDPEHVEHTGITASLAVSPDGKIVASASMDHSLRLWDVQSGRAIAALHGHLSEVWAVVFSPDGKSIISGAKDGTVNFWPIPEHSKDDFLEGPYVPIAFSAEGNQLAVFDEMRSAVVLFDPVNKRSLSEIKLDGSRPRGPFRGSSYFGLSADFNVVAQATEAGHVRITDLAAGTSTELNTSAVENNLEIELSPDGRQLVTGGWGQPFQWWDIPNQTNVSLGTGWRKMLFSPQGMLLGVSEKDTAEIFEPVGHSRKTVLRGEFNFGDLAAFSPEGHRVAIASNPLAAEQTIGIWDSVTGQLLGTLTGHKQGIHGLAFSADGRTLASSSDDSTIKLWNIATFQQMLSWPGPPRAQHMVFSGDGTILAVEQRAGSQSGVRFYNAPQPNAADAGYKPRP